MVPNNPKGRIRRERLIKGVEIIIKMKNLMRMLEEPRRRRRR
jgi:hypothetical protein